MFWATVSWSLLLVFLGVLIVLLFAAGAFLFVLPSLSLRAGCSVADVKEPRYLISFPLGYAVLVGYAGLAWTFVWFLGRLDTDPDAPLGAMHVCGGLLALAVGWVMASLVYRLAVVPTAPKGFFVAGVQLLMCALAAGLTWGVLLTTLAVWQLLGFQLPWSNAPAKPSAPAPTAAVVSDRT
jgi:hypothetical protein